MPAEDADRLIQPDADEVADVVKQRGADEDEAVEAVKQAAVAHIWTFKNGRAVKMIQVADTAEIINPKP